MGILKGPLNVVPADVMSWFCSAIPWRINERGQIEVLVMKYRPDPMDPKRVDEVQVKFVGETKNEGKKKDNEPLDRTPEDTLERGFLEEAGTRIVSYRPPLHTVLKPARNGRPAHRQYFCLVKIDKDAPLRCKPMWDGKELLEAPEWRVLDDALINEMFFTHQEAARRARVSITRLAL